MRTCSPSASVPVTDAFFPIATEDRRSRLEFYQGNSVSPQPTTIFRLHVSTPPQYLRTTGLATIGYGILPGNQFPTLARSNGLLSPKPRTMALIPLVILRSNNSPTNDNSISNREGGEKISEKKVRNSEEQDEMKPSRIAAAALELHCN
jgi:hypothetical protein